MDFIYEQDHVAVGLYLVYGVFEPLLEVAAVFGAGYHACKVEGEHYFILQKVGHLVVYYRLGEALHHRRFADARLAYEHGIIFGAAREYLNYLVYLLFAADDGIDLALARLLREVCTVFFYLASQSIALALAAL